jgi:RNA polymerase sigma factor (sigma-70 family)
MHDAIRNAQTLRERMSPLDARSDHFLLPLIQQGDRDALAELYERYAVRLGRVVAPRTGGIYDAEDVVQSAFRTFISTADNGHYDLPDGRDLWGLLVAIALNKLRSRTRYETARKRSPTGGRVEAPVVENEGNEAVDVRDVLERLPPEERELVELRVAGYVVGDIARRVGRSKRTVERQLQSCRDTLARLVATDA